MDAENRERWNQRYREMPDDIAPERFVVEAFEDYVRPAFPNGGTALDVAGGCGRHSMYLSERGWRVTLVDISDVAIHRARKTAEQRGCTLETVVGETAEVDLGHERFDLIVVSLYLERTLFSRLAKALRPGGILLYRTYTREHRKFITRVGNPGYYLCPGELKQAFASLQILHYDEGLGEPGMAQLVARKPIVA